MVDFINKINRSTLVHSILNILLGLAMFWQPRTVFRLSVNIIAAYLLILGIINLINSFQMKRGQQGKEAYLVYSLIYIVAALVIYFLAMKLVQAVPFLLGVIILFSGFGALFRASQLSRVSKINRWPLLLYGGVLILLSFVFIFRPIRSLIVLSRLYGIVLIVMGVVDLIYVFYLKNKVIETESVLVSEEFVRQEENR